MSYKNLFSEIKNLKLRFISAGWTRVHPFESTFETPSQLTKNKTPNEANIVLEFGDQLDKLIVLKCKCLNIKESTIYRFMVEEILSRDELESNATSFALGELQIRKAEIFEPLLELYSIKPGEPMNEIDVENYFGNVLLFEFTNGNVLELYGTEGDDQHEPSIFYKFIDSSKNVSYKRDRNKNWELKETI